jgi:hypothetical protein
MSFDLPHTDKTDENPEDYRYGKIIKIGDGQMGGKASGLSIVRQEILGKLDQEKYREMHVYIPDMMVIQTAVFDQFLDRNNLRDLALSDVPDDRLALAFQQAELPFEILGDLRTLVEKVHAPLAVRSSSLLEDSLYEPFAGVYSTKMIPNNQFDPNIRFRRLTEAIKYVYASAFFKGAKTYIKATKHSIEEEKMAVIIQEEVGKKFGLRFYPEVSGVARSYNFYPMGRAKHDDGIVHLALGLGKTIVDGGVSWSFAPPYAKVEPPYRTVKELLKISQTRFWAVNMGPNVEYNPIEETEYLTLGDLADAELDGALVNVASTFDPHSERLTMGLASKGPRVLTFAPLLVLDKLPLNQLITDLLAECEQLLEGPVEIEFAMTFDPNHFGFLQVRRMTVFDDDVEVSDSDLQGPNVLLSSDNVLGNGSEKGLMDIVYIKPESFSAKYSREIAQELAELNKTLVDKGKSYLLIVFGRLGTTDPWLGIPINWEQVAGARAIVEVATEDFNVVLSQGSHYFHNLVNLKVSYFSIKYDNGHVLDWEWLESQQLEHETKFLRHVLVPVSLAVLVDGRSGKGVIYKS